MQNKNKNENEELKILEAVQTMAEYRNKYTPNGGFKKLCEFLRMIMNVASKKHICPICGNESELYVNTE